jgi:FkbM family methyltransferase
MKKLFKSLFKPSKPPKAAAPVEKVHSPIKLLRHHRIGLVLDVGAHQGQYGLKLRKMGFDGRIVSFEPQQGPYERLLKASAEDAQWNAVNIAIGDRDGAAQFNISENEVSSSFLPVTSLGLESEPRVRSSHAEEVQIRRLDSLWDDYVPDETRVFLKIDVQGYTLPVLAGAPKTLSKVIGVQLEISLAPLYHGEPLLMEMLERMNKLGFELESIENGFRDPRTGRMLQLDGLFFRES